MACPGCYAYNDGHLGDTVTLRHLSDYHGPALVERFFRLIDAHKPLHVSIVGGEPLVRFRELNEILPRLSAQDIYAQVVTSAVRPIPEEWRGLRNLEISVSIDGLRPEHDIRRAPATYDRIQKHIAGHQITVHCTVTRQQVRRPGYLEEFVDLWSRSQAVRKILVSLYTPQLGEVSAERLEAEDREVVVADLRRLRARFAKLRMPKEMIAVYADPPASPDDCGRKNRTDTSETFAAEYIGRAGTGWWLSWGLRMQEARDAPTTIVPPPRDATDAVEHSPLTRDPARAVSGPGPTRTAHVRRRPPEPRRSPPGRRQQPLPTPPPRPTGLMPTSPHRVLGAETLIAECK